MSSGRLKETVRCHPYAADVGLALVLLAVALLMQRDGGLPAWGQLTPAVLVLEVLVFCALSLRSTWPWPTTVMEAARQALVHVRRSSRTAAGRHVTT